MYRLWIICTVNT